MRKLVIGCGYLGRRVAAAWQREGHDVFALTRSEAHAEEFRSLGWTPWIGDVTRPETLSGLPTFETVLHAVGYDRGAGPSQRDVYVDGLANVLRVFDDRAQYVIAISSTSVYGQTDGSWVDETSPCEPTRENGRICREAEELVMRWAQSRGGTPRGHVLRLSGIYGPKRLLQRVESLRAGTPLSGNPDAWLNLIHVDDGARAVLASEAKRPESLVTLVSDDRPLLRREYYSLLARLVGAPPVRFAEPVEASAAADFNKRCRNARLREQLGVELEFPTVEAGLPQALSLS